jgi:hypothetical protein
LHCAGTGIAHLSNGSRSKVLLDESTDWNIYSRFLFYNGSLRRDGFRIAGHGQSHDGAVEVRSSSAG